MANSPSYSRYAAEFLGTMLLVFTVGCNVLNKTAVFGGVSIASVLMVMIYSLGGISGANFNPAVSLALGCAKQQKALGFDDFGWWTVGSYILIQLLAGMVAGEWYMVFLWDAFPLEPAKGFNTFQMALCEMLYTFMLCFVVLNVCSTTKDFQSGEEPQYGGLAVGFVIVAGAYGAGKVSGGCFNPAVALGIEVAGARSGYVNGYWFLAYAIFECLGALMAVAVFKIVRTSQFDEVSSRFGVVSKLVAEFVGTYMLVLTVGLNVLGSSPAAAFSIAACLMCMIYAVGDLSGGHFNPAVTIAIKVSGFGDQTTREVLLYIAAQLSGATMAALTYTLIYTRTFGLGPGKPFNMAQAAVAEILFTMVLCLVVLCVAVLEPTKSKQMYGFAIGSCVTVGGCAIGKISGGSLNPAVSFGIELSNVIAGGLFYKAILYSIFEIIGGVLAAYIVKATHAGTQQQK